jgi:hypothetical protein
MNWEGLKMKWTCLILTYYPKPGLDRKEAIKESPQS